jgi:hypothetical protein
MKKQNFDGFYPVPYLIQDIDGELKIHLDLGDDSFSGYRLLNFSRKSVIHKGLIAHSDDYVRLNDIVDFVNRSRRFAPQSVELCDLVANFIRTGFTSYQMNEK